MTEQVRITSEDAAVFEKMVGKKHRQSEAGLFCQPYRTNLAIVCLKSQKKCQGKPEDYYAVYVLYKDAKNKLHYYFIGDLHGAFEISTLQLTRKQEALVRLSSGNGKKYWHQHRLPLTAFQSLPQ